MDKVSLPIGSIMVYRWWFVPTWLLWVTKTKADIQGLDVCRWNIHVCKVVWFKLHVTKENGKTHRSIKAGLLGSI